MCIPNLAAQIRTTFTKKEKERKGVNGIAMETLGTPVRNVWKRHTLEDLAEVFEQAVDVLLQAARLAP
jgi:hypothetical protein